MRIRKSLDSTVDEDQADVKKTRCANHKLEAAVGRAK